ncbi:SPOR domain-containing protein [Rhabdobacter roseus]|uniref:Cell division septation protein DedD n=1 Tax=Rhabdobacter roseus TaxID=1655419 RepID=A0A840TIK3_9BACT|nr:SPOR domain-containing protein [Rhabdobacter roseus]MBB5283171.1 cell division septation protein DedD [Rhabdobacter roseus]
MVAVDKYLRKLLYEQDCVIIPDFGGLLTHQVQAQYNSRQGTFTPSQKRVAFNEVLKFDDGLLTYFISENERMAREEAQGYVKQYTEGLRNQLQQQGVAEVNGIGAFRTNSEGKLVFEPTLSQNFNSEWYGFQDVKAMELKQPASEPELNAEEIRADDQEAVETSPIMRPLGWVRWAAAAAVVGLAFYVSAFYAPTVSDSTLSSLNPFYSLIDYVQPMVEKGVPGSELANAQVPAVESVSNPSASPVETPKEEVPTLLAVAYVPATPAAKAPEVHSEANLAKSKRYQLVAGSFNKVDNAEDLLVELKRQGYPEAHILESRGLIKVSAAGFDTQKSAYAELKQLEKVAGKGVWVYEKKKKK